MSALALGQKERDTDDVEVEVEIEVEVEWGTGSANLRQSFKRVISVSAYLFIIIFATKPALRHLHHLRHLRPFFISFFPPNIVSHP